MNVSIVIPVYNEGERLAACLNAISAQTIKPFEVIVVDNNSTDGTLKIAESFDFVTVLSESRQGVVHARNRGFNTAQGDIIGRIDADTILPADWVSYAVKIFDNRAVSAVSGSAHYYDFALDKVADKFDFVFRGHLARQLGNDIFLWGANMAIRRSDWLRIRGKLCESAYLHEDFDLAIHLQQAGQIVKYDPGLAAGVSCRRIDTKLVDYIKYTLVSPKTYKYHGLACRRHMYPVLLACWVAYLPGRIIYRTYDQSTGRFSLSRLFVASTQRVDPSGNVV